MTGLEQVTDACAGHGEGPVWDPGVGAIRWVDMLAGDILTLDGATGSVSRTHVGSVAAAFRPRMTGGLVIAVERGFALMDPDGTLHHHPDLWRDPAVRMNDGGCDPQGRFYCGSMAYDESPSAGRLYRLDLDGSVAVVLEDLTISNGLAWSPDGETVYHVDSPTGSVTQFRFDSETGTFHDAEVVVKIESADGVPDGLCIDARGDLWVALWGGSAVRHYTRSGELVEVVDLPVPLVTACTFGGDDLSDLYITTSRMGVPPGQQPEAGALFRIRPGAQGAPALLFGA